MDTVDLGGVRLHVVTAYPGLPGEGERVSRALAKLDPAVVLADMDTDDALRLREFIASGRGAFEPSFVDALFQAEAQRRFAPGDPPSEHPLLAAARLARDRKATCVPLRPLAERPGFFARRRGAKAARAARGATTEDFPEGFAAALEREKVWTAQADVEAAHKRLMHALSEGRAPIALVLQAHRAAPFLESLQSTRRIAP